MTLHLFWRQHFDNALILGGIFYFSFAFAAILKFSLPFLFGIIGLIYFVSLGIVGVALILISFSFAYYGYKFSTSLGYLCSLFAAIAGLGYLLISLGALFRAMLGLAPLYLGISFSRTGLFFYSVFSIAFFGESTDERLGVYGGLLILLFAASLHFFVFAQEFFGALPGAVASMLAGVGFMLQGFDVRRLAKRRFKLEYPPENARVVDVS